MPTMIPYSSLSIKGELTQRRSRRISRTQKHMKKAARFLSGLRNAMA